MSFGFDLTKVDVESNERGALPAGTYTAKIEKVEKRTSKSNESNKYLNVTYKVCDMEKRNGAVFFDMVNIYNTNTEAENIGRKRLKSMFVACGATEDQMNSLTPEWFIGKKVDCVIGVEKDSQYGDRNRVYQITATNKASNTSEKIEDNHVPSWL